MLPILGLPSIAGVGEQRARIFGLEPVDHRLDAVDLGIAEVVLGAQRGGHVDMGDVVAGGRIDPVERLEKDPVFPEAFGDLRKIGAVVAGEAVAQVAAVVAGIGVVEAGLALEHGLAAGDAAPAEGDGEQCVAHGAALAERTAAAARAFEIARRQVDALRDGAVHLLGVETADLGGGHRAPENPEHRPRVKPARHHGRDELGGHPLHDLVTGGDPGEEGFPRRTGRLGRGERRRQYRGAGMGQHAKGVPLAAGEDDLGVDEGGAGLGQLGAAAQHGPGPAAARLLLLHQRQGLAARRHRMRDERRPQRLQGDALGPVNDRRRQVLVAEIGDEGGELAAQRHAGSSGTIEAASRSAEIRAVAARPAPVEAMVSEPARIALTATGRARPLPASPEPASHQPVWLPPGGACGAVAAAAPARCRPRSSPMRRQRPWWPSPRAWWRSLREQPLPRPQSVLPRSCASASAPSGSRAGTSRHRPCRHPPPS